VLRGLFRRFDTPADLKGASPSRPGPDALAIRWLGTAAHRIRFGGKTLLLDPFVSRPGIGSLLRPLRPDPGAIDRWAPEADAVVVGHAHYDHLLDAPAIARRTGAVLLGSRSTARVAVAHGVERARIAAAGEHGLAAEVGPFSVELVPSLHAKILLGRSYIFPGEIRRVPSRPLRVHQYRDGGALGVIIRAGDVTVYHNGSADLVDAALEGKRADVLLCGIAGWRYTAGYLERLVRLLSPRLIVPTHYDAFFWPLEEGVRLLPGLAFERFLDEVARVAPGTRVLAPGPWEELRVSDGGRSFEVVPIS
jgi:L-ascorbate metabolism protein UlaG (beta-lactamase superfamily)